MIRKTGLILTLLALGLALAVSVTGPVAASGLNQASQQTFGLALDFWAALLLMVILLAGLAWWALHRAAPTTTHHVHDDHAEHAAHAIDEVVEEAADEATEAVEEAAGAVEEVADEAAEAVEDAADEAAEAVEDAADEVAEAIEEVADEAAEVVEEAAADEAASAVEDAADEAAAEPVEPDNLRRIEGIGPKVAGALNDAGILTFAQITEHTPEQLMAIMQEANVRVLPGAAETWPEQAALAAKGDWEGFEKLQDELKGGRRAD